MGLRPFQALRRNADGSTIVEFSLIAPVLCLLLMGLFDLGFQLYARSILQGAMQDAGRDSALEDGATSATAIDANVRQDVQRVLPNATLSFQRRNYASFSDVAQPEAFTDTAGAENGVCDNGEPFEDVNGNGVWDTDRGQTGVGGARDAVLYTATVTYNRVFPFHDLVGLPQQVTMEASTVMRNQPYDAQANRAPVVGNCT